MLGARDGIGVVWAWLLEQVRELGLGEGLGEGDEPVHRNIEAAEERAANRAAAHVLAPKVCRGGR